MSFAEAFNAAVASETPEPEVPADAGTTEGSEPEVEAPAEDVVADPTEPVTDTPEPDVAKYTTKVDGEDVEVTLEELLAGYSRTSDYTKKTQALAADRQRLAQAEALTAALASDPEGTLRLLAESYGIGQGDGDIELDPDEARIVALERAEATRQEEARMTAIDAGLAHLHQQYGEFDDVQLLQFAVQRDLTDLGDAFKAMKFEEVYADATAKRAADKAKADEDAIAAKRAATVVEGGTSRSAAGTEAERPERPTIRQAYEMATRS